MTKKTLLLLGLGTLIFVAGCRRNDEDDTTAVNLAKSISKEDAMAQNLFDDAFKNSDEVANDKGLNKNGAYSFGNCATVTLDTAGSVKQFTIDFGTTNCTGTDGRIRRGKILVTWSGKYFTVGNPHTISFDNYYVNEYKVEGTKKVSYMGLNSSNQPYWEIEITGGKVTKPAGTDFITHNSKRTLTWTEGHDTWLNWLDNKFELTGNASGSNKAGNTYTINVTTPLLYTFNCQYYLVSGKLELNIDNYDPIYVDYGNKECDNKGTATYNAKSYDFTF